MLHLTTIKPSDLSNAMLGHLHATNSCMDGATCVRFFTDAEAVFQPKPAPSGGSYAADGKGNLVRTDGIVTVRFGGLIRTHYGYSSIVSCLRDCYGI